MHFSFDDEQHAFATATRAVLTEQCRPGVVRAAWDAPPGTLDRGIWDLLVALGVNALLIDEQHGGMGLNEVWSALVLEEAGKAALPHPLIETAIVAAAFDPSVATGTMISTNLGGPNIPCAADADRLLLFDGDGQALHLVARESVELTEVIAVDRARRLATVTWTPTSQSIVTDDAAEIALARDRGAFATAATLLGLATTMLSMTSDYVRERHQFGVPVGSFQAVKHQLADALMQLSFARPAVHRASWSIANNESTRSRDVSMAKAMASDAALTVARASLQCHGAIGYTIEHDLHLYLKRAIALARSWGSPNHHRQRVAAAIRDEPEDRR
jgi:alkylation response protein AidB-like acyl-CoA dehydrogenase